MAEATLIDVEEEGRDSKSDLYGCTSCSEKIPNTKARILCNRCLNYHLCSNCYVIKDYAKPHVDSHPTSIITKSGFFVPGAPPVPPKPAPALPPRVAPAPSIKDTVEIPTADWGLLWNIMKAPLQKKAPKKEDITPIEIKDVTGVGYANGLSLPPSPPKSINLLDDAAPPMYPMPTAWEPLFAADSTPTPVFISLMSTIFSHLDPNRTGYISPETYSDFLDAQGYQWNANVWKNALDSENNENPKDLADLEFGSYLAEMSISHELRVRADHESNDDSAKASDAASNEIPVYSPKMPMLTKQGFLDLSAIEYLVNPDKALDYLRKAVTEYGIWKELGEMPRSVLPNNSLPKVSKIKASAVEDGNDKREEVQATKLAPPALPMRNVVAKPKTPGMKDEFDDIDLEKRTASEPVSVKEASDKSADKTMDKEPVVKSVEVENEKDSEDDFEDSIVMMFEKN